MRSRLVLALLPLLVCLEVTALPHLLAEAFGEDEDCCQTCDDAAPGQKCPPLCPTCACAHVPQMITPAEGPRPTLATLSRRPAGVHPSQRHQDPDLDGIFHPPRG